MPQDTATPAKPRRRSRRRDFGCVIGVGTTTEPRFAVRWFETDVLGKASRRQQGGFKTRKEAQEFLAKRRTEIASGEAVAQRKAEITLEAVADKWLKLHSAQLRSDKDNRERWDLHVKPRLGACKLSALSAEVLLEFRGQLIGEGKLKPATINRVLALVRSILNFAVAHGFINASPVSRIRRGGYMLSVERKKIAPPIENPADVGRLLEKIRDLYPRLHALFATAVYCGLRKGELCGLRWEDVHLDDRFLLVRRSYDGLTKSSKWRSVPIPEPLVAILAAHRLACPFKNELAFPADDGSMLTPDSRLQDRLADAIEVAGVTYRPVVEGWSRLHDLRHEHASMYLALGGSIHDLQKNLGHSSVSVTEIYAHSADAHRIREAQRLRFEAPSEENVVPMKRGS